LLLATSFSVSNIMARVATIPAPQVAEIKRPVPMLCFAISGSIALLTAFFLRIPKDKETLLEEVIKKREKRQGSKKPDKQQLL
jgi:hypothetical protein